MLWGKKFIRRAINAMDKETDNHVVGTPRRAEPTVPQTSMVGAGGRALKKNQIRERGAQIHSQRYLRKEAGFIAGVKPKARFSSRERRA